MAAYTRGRRPGRHLRSDCGIHFVWAECASRHCKRRAGPAGLRRGRGRRNVDTRRVSALRDRILGGRDILRGRAETLVPERALRGVWLVLRHRCFSGDESDCAAAFGSAVQGWTIHSLGTAYRPADAYVDYRPAYFFWRLEILEVDERSIPGCFGCGRRGASGF